MRRQQLADRALRPAMRSRQTPQGPRLEDTGRSPRRAATVAPQRRCCNDRLNPVSTSRSATPNASPRSASPAQWAAEATPTTTPWPNRSSGSTRPNSSATGDPWRGLDDLELATLEWIDWFNHRRLFHDLGRIPPTEFEHHHHHRHTVSTEPTEPRLTPPSLRRTRGGSGTTSPLVTAYEPWRLLTAGGPVMG